MFLFFVYTFIYVLLSERVEYNLFIIDLSYGTDISGRPNQLSRPYASSDHSTRGRSFLYLLLASPFVLHRDCSLPHTDCLVSDVMLEVVRISLSLILRTPNRSQQLNPASTTPLRILILSFDRLVL
jgi:hypothetical protein